MVKAVIFDLDGVLVDTKEVYYKATRQLFKEEFGKIITKKECEGMFGKLDVVIIGHFLKKFRLKGDIEELRQKKKKLVEKLESANLKIFPGAKELVRSLSKKYKLALVSSTWKNLVIKALDVFGMRNYFSVIVGKMDVKNHKPHPEPYLFAAKRLKVKPSECVVIEDSVAGVEAGKRAGMNVIAVTTSYSKDKLKKADLIVKSVAEISL